MEQNKENSGSTRVHGPETSPKEASPEVSSHASSTRSRRRRKRSKPFSKNKSNDGPSTPAPEATLDRPTPSFKHLVAENINAIPELNQLSFAKPPDLSDLADRVRKMSTGNNMNGGMNRQGPAPMNAQQGNGAVNGAGAGANGYASVAAINASQQMDVNFIYEKLKELGDVVHGNRTKAQGVINSAEQLAAKAATTGTNPSLQQANNEITANRLADLALALKREQQKTAILLREQQANTALLAEYEEGVGNITSMMRTFAAGVNKSKTDIAKHYNGLLQAEKDEHLQTRLERDEYLARFMRCVEMLRTASRLANDEADEHIGVVSGLQSEVRTYRACLGMEKERFEDEGGYSILKGVVNGAGERLGQSGGAGSGGAGEKGKGLQGLSE